MLVPDKRNVGGVQEIDQLMANHANKLLNVESAIHITAPHPHINNGFKKADKLPYEDVLYKDSFSQVRATFVAVNSMKKGRLDIKEPDTMNIKRPKTKNKKELYLQNEHNKNMKSMNNKIKKGLSKQERKKNPYDPVAHPSLFLRTKKEDEATSQYKQLHSKIQSKRASTAKTFHQPTTNLPASISRLNDEYDKKILSQKKSHNMQSLNKIVQQPLETPVEIYHRTSHMTKENDMKGEIVNKIIDDRIYKAEDIRNLVMKEKEKNPYIGDEYLNSLANQIIAEFKA